MKQEDICKHEDRFIYLDLKQLDGKPCYTCYCYDCKKYFIIWLEEGKNENIGDVKDYYKLKKHLV